MPSRRHESGTPTENNIMSALIFEGKDPSLTSLILDDRLNTNILGPKIFFLTNHIKFLNA